MKKKLAESRFNYLWRAVLTKRTMYQSPDDTSPGTFEDLQKHLARHPGDLISFELVSLNKVYTVDFGREWCPIIYYDEKGRYGAEKHALLHKEKRTVYNPEPIYERTEKDGRFEYKIGYIAKDEQGRTRKKTIKVV